jgi:hypothetical protein
MATTRVHDHDDHDDTIDAHYAGLERLEALALLKKAPHGTPHGCYDGLVFVGYLVEGEDGEEAEIVESIPCKRCASEAPRS